MTHKQKPESAEFRTREAQLDEIYDATAKAVCRGRSDYPPAIYRAYLGAHIARAEARGAAEQRRKDAEGCIPVHQFFMDGIWTDCSPKVYANQPCRRILYTHPANVAALTAEAVAAERERCAKVCEKDAPKGDYGILGNVGDALNRTAAAIREGGEHG